MEQTGRPRTGSGSQCTKGVGVLQVDAVCVDSNVRVGRLVGPADMQVLIQSLGPFWLIWPACDRLWAQKNTRRSALSLSGMVPGNLQHVLKVRDYTQRALFARAL